LSGLVLGASHYAIDLKLPARVDYQNDRDNTFGWRNMAKVVTPTGNRNVIEARYLLEKAVQAADIVHELEQRQAPEAASLSRWLHESTITLKLGDKNTPIQIGRIHAALGALGGTPGVSEAFAKRLASEVAKRRDAAFDQSPLK
jgi:hypothetical protein